MGKAEGTKFDLVADSSGFQENDESLRVRIYSL